MSHIATALAKSQGRDVKLPPGAAIDDVPLARVGPVENPFLHTVATQQVQPVITADPTAQPPGKSALRKLILGLGVLVAAVLGVAVWAMLRGDNPFAGFLPGAQPASTTAPVPAGQRATPAAQAKAAAPSDLLREKVRSFVITSAAGGSIQRITIGGKVFQPGETVAEGLVLQVIENEEIIFRDTAGHLYTRHR